MEILLNGLSVEVVNASTGRKDIIGGDGISSHSITITIIQQGRLNSEITDYKQICRYVVLR